MNTYKAFQLEEFDLKFSLVNADLINGTIPASQREKCDQIKIWQESLYTSTSTLMVIATLSLLSSTTRNIMWWGAALSEKRNIAHTRIAICIA